MLIFLNVINQTNLTHRSDLTSDFRETWNQKVDYSKPSSPIIEFMESLESHYDDIST